MTAALDDAHMQESVARTVGKLDEAEALIRVVPLDGSSDGWAGRAVELWTARRRIPEITGWRLVVVVGEIAAAGRAKISVSVAHGGFLRELPLSFGYVSTVVNPL
jgi:hypothetical protein